MLQHHLHPVVLHSCDQFPFFIIRIAPFLLPPPPNKALDNILDIFFDLSPPFIDTAAVVSNNDLFKSFAKSAKPNKRFFRFFFFDFMLDCFETLDSCVRRISVVCICAFKREKRERKRNGLRGEQMVKETTNGVKERTHSLKTSPFSSLSSSRVSLFLRLQTTTSHQFWTTGLGGSSSNRFRAFFAQ